jgi:hypothetical protein
VNYAFIVFNINGKDEILLKMQYGNTKSNTEELNLPRECKPVKNGIVTENNALSTHHRQDAVLW